MECGFRGLEWTVLERACTHHLRMGARFYSRALPNSTSTSSPRGRAQRWSGSNLSDFILSSKNFEGFAPLHSSFKVDMRTRFNLFLISLAISLLSLPVLADDTST